MMEKFVEWLGVDYFNEISRAMQNGYEFEPIGKLDLVIHDDLDGVDFGLSTQAKNALKKANIETLGDLVRFSRSELYHIQGLSKSSAYKVIMGLREFGLEMRRD